MISTEQNSIEEKEFVEFRRKVRSAEVSSGLSGTTDGRKANIVWPSGGQ